MCGILTYYNPNGLNKISIVNSLASLQRIKHRGPDGEGLVLIDSKTGNYCVLNTPETPKDINTSLVELESVVEQNYDLLLGHRRLSIFDTTSAGHQPMKDGSGNWIIFNGEIYNFFEVKDELISKGYVFYSGTDTEVILAAYLEWGSDCLNRFNGMWTIVLWDGKKKELFISNDRFGVKPLYYMQNGEELILCSEVKQFMEFNRIKKENLNRSVIHTFLETNYLDYNEETFFNNINRFKPGNFIQFKKGGNLLKQQRPYYNFIERIDQKRSEKDQLEEFSYLLKSAVEVRMRADVNWGVTVSGGLDSSAIAYQARQLTGSTFNTFSAIFPGQEGDESIYIKRLVEDLNLTSHTVNPLESFNFQDIEKHIYHQDFPIQSTSFYAEWSVARLAQEKGVKIILNGQGADEVFAGYHHHFYRYCRELILSGRIRIYLKEIKAFAALKAVPVNQLHSLILGEVKLGVKFKLGLVKMSNVLAQNWNKAETLIKLLRLDFSEVTIPTYLRSDDRDGMAFSIESRHPFMDYRLVEFGFNLPNKFKIKEGWQKWIIRKSIEDQVASEIVWRKDKKGYTTPQKYWEEKYAKEFKENLGLLNEIGVAPKNDFAHYSLALWYKNNKKSW